MELSQPDVHVAAVAAELSACGRRGGARGGGGGALLSLVGPIASVLGLLGGVCDGVLELAGCGLAGRAVAGCGLLAGLAGVFRRSSTSSARSTQRELSRDKRLLSSRSWRTWLGLGAGASSGPGPGCQLGRSARLEKLGAR